MGLPRARRAFLQASLGALAFAGVVPPGFSANGFRPRPGIPGIVFVPVSTLAAITARPEKFLSVYNRIGGDEPAGVLIRSRLGPEFASLTDPGCVAIFASLVACKTASIGASALDPMNAKLGQLLSAETLVCGHFCKLATLLSFLGAPELIPPDADDTTGAPKASLHFLVWLDTVPLRTGFHSQLVISNVLDRAYLLLDPMYGYAVRIPFVGTGPQANLTVIENAALMMRTPIDPSNLAILDLERVNPFLQMTQTVLSGALGPQYIYHDSIYGSEGWDARIEQIIDNFG